MLLEIFITKYGDDALEAISKNIDPDLIKQLDDLGIKPSDYDNFRITGRESAEKVAKAVENAKYTIIPQDKIAKYISGEYNQVRGYITKAQDVKQLKNYDDIYNSLRLDYVGSEFNPATDECVGVIRFKTPEIWKIDIPYNQAMGGNAVAGPPFTGNGFTAATNGQAIPEFLCNGSVALKDGAELYIVTKDGAEILVAVYSKDLGRFVDILK